MALPKGFGYVLDFSDRTMAMFFDDEFGVDIYSEKYAQRGPSKRNHLICFLLDADTQSASQVLRAQWERREGLLAVNPDGVGARIVVSLASIKFKSTLPSPAPLLS